MQSRTQRLVFIITQKREKYLHMPSNQVNVRNIHKIGLYEQDDRLTTFTYW